MLVDTGRLLQEGRENGYAVGAFNIYNLEGALAVVQTAESMRSPVILQMLPSALQVGGRGLVGLCRGLAKSADVPVAIHLDHCGSRQFIEFALNAGIRSVMADGSELDFEENIAFTRKIVEITRAESVNSTVEAELGKISGSEDGLSVDALHSRMTDPSLAAEFIERTGVTALAVCIGNVHGKYHGKPRLEFDRLKRIAELVSIPLVLHGTSGLPGEMITRAIELGVCKFNVNTEVRMIYLDTMQKLLLMQEKIELVHLMEHSIEAMKEPIREKMQLFSSAGRA